MFELSSVPPRDSTLVSGAESRSVVPFLIRLVGEVIMITSPALITPKKWPGFMERARAVAISSVFELRKYDGTSLGMHEPGDGKNESLSIYRRNLHNLLHTFAKELGIPITFGARAIEFSETTEIGSVTLENGDKLTADVVVASDGVGSNSRAILDGNRDAPISSGFTIYRIAFPIGPALKNPAVAKAFGGEADRTFIYIGPKAHIVIIKSGGMLCWLLTTMVRSRIIVGSVILTVGRMRTPTRRKVGLNLHQR